MKFREFFITTIAIFSLGHPTAAQVDSYFKNASEFGTFYKTFPIQSTAGEDLSHQRRGIKSQTIFVPLGANSTATRLNQVKVAYSNLFELSNSSLNKFIEGHDADLVNTQTSEAPIYHQQREARKFNFWRNLWNKPKISPLFLINGTVCRFINSSPICTTLQTTGLLPTPAPGINPNNNQNNNNLNNNNLNNNNLPNNNINNQNVARVSLRLNPDAATRNISLESLIPRPSRIMPNEILFNSTQPPQVLINALKTVQQGGNFALDAKNSSAGLVGPTIKPSLNIHSIRRPGSLRTDFGELIGQRKLQALAARQQSGVKGK